MVIISKLPAMLLWLSMVGTGTILIYGAYRRWPCLVDPARKSRFIYSHAAVRAYLGRRAAIVYTYILGLAFLAGAALVLWNVLR